MSYRISAWMFWIWAILAVITAVVNLEDAPSSSAHGASYESAVNASLSPNEITIDTPTVGISSNPINTAIAYGAMAAGWLGFIAKSAALQSSIWESWTAPIRYGLMVLMAPYMWHVVKEVAGLFSNFIGGLAGRVGV